MFLAVGGEQLAALLAGSSHASGSLGFGYAMECQARQTLGVDGADRVRPGSGACAGPARVRVRSCIYVAAIGNPRKVAAGILDHAAKAWPGRRHKGDAEIARSPLLDHIAPAARDFRKRAALLGQLCAYSVRTSAQLSSKTGNEGVPTPVSQAGKSPSRRLNQSDAARGRPSKRSALRDPEKSSRSG